MARLALRHAPAPPPRRGHYSDDGRSWVDDVRGRSYGLALGVDTLEIELEDVAGRLVVGTPVVDLTVQEGPGWYRFVGHARSDDCRWREYAVIGGVFEVPRALRFVPDDPNVAWAPEMDARLAELRAELTAEGWLLAGKGEQPWAYRYTRPWVELDH